MTKQMLWASLGVFLCCNCGDDTPSPDKVVAEWQRNNPEIVSKVQQALESGGEPPAPISTVSLPSKPEDTDTLRNEYLKIGVNKGAGGVITFLADTKTNKNMVNNYDLGRQIQMSLYGSPVPYSQNGKQPHSTWVHAGWNPVQAGDTYGNWSKTLELKKEGNSKIYAKSVPMQWALNGESCDCVFESWIELEQNTVKIKNRLTNNRNDKKQYDAHFQELPAVFLNSDWYKILTYSGDRPFTNDAINERTQNQTGHYATTENWTAIVDESNWGLGLWKPDTYMFTSGFFGKIKSGGDRAFATAYMAPVESEILDNNIVYEYDYVLILGNIQQIRNYVYQNTVREKRGLDFRFENNRQHWSFSPGTTDGGFPVRGELVIPLTQPLTELVSPWGHWSAPETPKLYLTAAYETTQKTGRLYWKTQAQAQAFTPEKSMTFDIIADGKYHTYELDMKAQPEWKGMIHALNLAPIDRQKGGTFKIKSLSYKP